MPANPLQDNGLPRYNWLNRIIISARSEAISYTCGKVTACPASIRHQIRREIVRVAKAFIGYRQWKWQCGDSAYIAGLERWCAQLKGQNETLRLEIARLKQMLKQETR